MFLFSLGSTVDRFGDKKLISKLCGRRHKVKFGRRKPKQNRHLFERSEFLIDTSPKKSLRVCPCVVCLTYVGFSVGYPINIGLSVGYVSCTRYVCTWYQPAEITSCEKHSMVLYIYMNPTHGPRAWSLDDRWRL